MKYFAKYLPYEGEIKEGDKYWDNKFGVRDDYNRHSIILPLVNGDVFKPVKLFLCSRDIQVGDDIYDNVGRLWKNCEECWYKAMKGGGYGFKVIGEISPNAIWVKEEDEFDENEIALGMGNNNYVLSDIKTESDPQNLLGKKWYIPKEKWSNCQIRIKCPNCQTFH